MAQPDFDLTEYQDSRWEQYRSQWEGCDDLSPSFWDNSVSYAAEEVERWRSELQSIREKFGALFQVQPPDPLYPHDVSEREVNAFSGTEITVPLGEGLLNFCYAGFCFRI